MIRILLVDDQRSIREALRLMLDSASDFQVIGTASDGHTAIEQAGLLKPDIVLIDMEMPGLDGVSATRIISQQFESVKVLVLSMHDDDALISQSMQAGAMGYLLKNTPPEELRAAIRFVKRGYAQMGPGLLEKMVTAEPPSTNGNGHQVESRDLGRLSWPLENGTQSEPAAKTLLNAREETVAQSNGHYLPSGLPQSETISEHELLAQSIPQPEEPQTGRWKKYFAIGLLLNLLIWSAAIAVLKLKRPLYTSNWTLDLPASRSDTMLEVPGVGRAAESNVSPYSNIMVADPRANYKDLLTTPELIKSAAKIAEVPYKEFTPPRIEVVPNTTLIKLSVIGLSPRDAHQRATAIQAAFTNEINSLRQQELAQQNKNLKVALDSASERLKDSQQRLSPIKLRPGSTLVSSFAICLSTLRRCVVSELRPLDKGRILPSSSDSFPLRSAYLPNRQEMPLFFSPTPSFSSI